MASVSPYSAARLQRSVLLRDSILSLSKSRELLASAQNSVTEEDFMFMHILDCIGAVASLRENQKSSSSSSSNGDALLGSKYRVFWQSVREIADQEIASEASIDKNMPRNEPLNAIMQSFPDDRKRSDGRMWLPLHFAVSLPHTSLADMRSIFNARPQAIKATADEAFKYNPCHLAAMTKNPRLEVVNLLKIFYPRFGSSLAFTAQTPLHLAAAFSNSAAMIRELVQVHPPALEMRTAQGFTPLIFAFNNKSVEAPNILQAILDAAPQTARMTIPNLHHMLPLHLFFLETYCNKVLEMVTILLAAYKEAMNIPNDLGLRPVDYAAKFAPADVFKFILDEFMGTYSLAEVPHLALNAALGRNPSNLKYIYSVAPDKVLPLNAGGNSLLHRILNSQAFKTDLSSPLSAAADVLQFLLHHCPSMVTTTDSAGRTPYDYLPPTGPTLTYARRLLLLAGASSLHPGMLQNLNYAARREALLIFHSSSTDLNIFSRIANSAGGAVLIRTIVCFL